ncbi:unnamed protein product [Prorocentrum cordatum]|uniref:Protein kinase domain-containing protein n=1 Tax=Prorocentrum cordatum TaxID=2364126 RepID=A0ABN9Y314_9DINO|nr:unnamed protein product [Polarella glacialis]
MARADQLILEVDPREIKYLSVIGEGTTAVVHLARFNGAEVAVKEIRASAECAGCDEGTLQDSAVEREIGTLSQVKHENIVMLDWDNYSGSAHSPRAGVLCRRLLV